MGTSGWNYKHWWNNEFYPSNLKPADWLKFFSRHFLTVEINNSFYRPSTESAFQNWRIQVPPHFVFADVQEVREWLKRGLDAYVYFNDDLGGHAIRNARYVQRA